MHFTYSEGPVEASVLSQGDVLKRTPELDQVLRKYYSYFGANEENQFFLVLTQACDLVPRNEGICKARYIELAAVRPLSVVLQRELAAHADTQFELPYLVAGQKRRAKFEQFLERLYNNNEQEYFFLRAEPTVGLPEDSCAFLHLSVPIKALDNYSVCLNARILSLTNLFQAKLGWLVGQLYARVGTTDWDPQSLRAAVTNASATAGIWIEDKLLKGAASAAKLWQEQNPGVRLDQQQLTKLLTALPSKKSQAVEHLGRLLSNSNLIRRLTESGSMNTDDLQKLLKQINSDSRFSAFFS